MKNLLFILTIIIAGSCSNTRQGFAQQFEQYARTELASDSLLRKLQQAHELVLAVSVETYAWVKSATIRVLALSNNEWTGYSYYVNKSQTGIVPNINPVVVNNDSCNAAWKYLQENKTGLPGD